MEDIGVYFDIGKQKVVWILKCRENDEKVAGNAVSRLGCQGLLN